MADAAAAAGSDEPQRSYSSLLRLSGVRAFVLAGFLGRLPMSMLGLGIVVLISDIRHSYAVAGAVSATFTCAGALGSPALGALSDRLGQRPVLAASVPHVVCLAGLVALIMGRAPVWTLFPAAAVTGALLPPVSSLLRARWTFLLGGGTPAAEQAYALEAIIDELVFIIGPVLVTTLAGAVTPVSGLACSGAFVVVGCLLLAGQPATAPPAHGKDRQGRGALRVAGVRVLIAACAVLAVALGTIDVGMVGFAREHGITAYSGFLLACVAAGSGTSAIWYGRVRWRASLQRRFLAGCGGLVLTTLPLTFAGSVPVLVPLGYLCGLAISPALIAGFGLVERLVPRPMLTEGLTWISTALAFGVGIGVTVSGRAIDAFGASRSFLICPSAVLLGGLIAFAGLPALRRRATDTR